MKTIFLKGQNKTVTVSDAVGERINLSKKQGIDGWVGLDGWSGYLSDIRSIGDGIDEQNRERYKAEIKDKSSKASDEYYDQVNLDHRNEIKRLLLSSTKEKLDYNLRFISFICFAMTGMWLKDWVRENPQTDLINILNEELKTEKLIVRPSKYKHIFSFSDGIDSSKLPRHSSIRLVERQMQSAFEIIREISK